MEYVEGQQLDDYIKNVSGPINENELIPLFTQIVDAISHAHSKGLIHRDIKPANIIISENKIKVLDFGIAKEISEESEESERSEDREEQEESEDKEA